MPVQHSPASGIYEYNANGIGLSQNNSKKRLSREGEWDPVRSRLINVNPTINLPKHIDIYDSDGVLPLNTYYYYQHNHHINNNIENGENSSSTTKFHCNDSHQELHQFNNLDIIKGRKYIKKHNRINTNGIESQVQQPIRIKKNKPFMSYCRCDNESLYGVDPIYCCTDKCVCCECGVDCIEAFTHDPCIIDENEEIFLSCDVPSSHPGLANLYEKS